MATPGGAASRSPSFPVSPLGIRAGLSSAHARAGPGDRLRGPRQIGKTTLLTQVVDQLMQDGVDPRRLFRLQFDDLIDIKTLGMPIVEMVEWYAREVLGETLNKAASEGRAPYVFLDEVQNLADWAPQLKHLVDLGKVRAMVTGSSALRIEAGRDSLAGRVQTIEMGPLLFVRSRPCAGSESSLHILSRTVLRLSRTRLSGKSSGNMARFIGSFGTVRSRRSLSEGLIRWPRFVQKSRGKNWRIF